MQFNIINCREVCSCKDLFCYLYNKSVCKNKRNPSIDFKCRYVNSVSTLECGSSISGMRSTGESLWAPMCSSNSMHARQGMHRWPRTSIVYRHLDVKANTCNTGGGISKHEYYGPTWLQPHSYTTVYTMQVRAAAHLNVCTHLHTYTETIVHTCVSI